MGAMKGLYVAALGPDHKTMASVPRNVSLDMRWRIGEDGRPVMETSQTIRLTGRADSVVLFVADGNQWEVIVEIDLRDERPRPDKGDMVTADLHLHLDSVTPEVAA
jgi:hypothetical protein